MPLTRRDFLTLLGVTALSPEVFIQASTAASEQFENRSNATAFLTAELKRLPKEMATYSYDSPENIRAQFQQDPHNLPLGAAAGVLKDQPLQRPLVLATLTMNEHDFGQMGISDGRVNFFQQVARHGLKRLVDNLPDRQSEWEKMRQFHKWDKTMGYGGFNQWALVIRTEKTKQIDPEIQPAADLIVLPDPAIAGRPLVVRWADMINFLAQEKVKMGVDRDALTKLSQEVAQRAEFVDYPAPPTPENIDQAAKKILEALKNEGGGDGNPRIVFSPSQWHKIFIYHPNQDFRKYPVWWLQVDDWTNDYVILTSSEILISKAIRNRPNPAITDLITLAIQNRAPNKTAQDNFMRNSLEIQKAAPSVYQADEAFGIVVIGTNYVRVLEREPYPPREFLLDPRPNEILTIVSSKPRKPARAE